MNSARRSNLDSKRVYELLSELLAPHRFFFDTQRYLESCMGAVFAVADENFLLRKAPNGISPLVKQFFWALLE